MAVKTIYICDKCGTEQDSAHQFWTVGVTANSATYVSEEFVPHKYMQVCRKCLESFGIFVQHRPEHKDNPPVVPTVEELIRELVQRCS